MLHIIWKLIPLQVLTKQNNKRKSDNPFQNYKGYKYDFKPISHWNPHNVRMGYHIPIY